MMHTVKRAAKIGAGVILLSAIAGAVAGYVHGRRKASYHYDYDMDDDDDGMDRSEAFKDMVHAGKQMKNAWGRIQQDIKIIAKETVNNMTDEDDEAEGEGS